MRRWTNTNQGFAWSHPYYVLSEHGCPTDEAVVMIAKYNNCYFACIDLNNDNYEIIEIAVREYDFAKRYYRDSAFYSSGVGIRTIPGLFDHDLRNYFETSILDVVNNKFYTSEKTYVNTPVVALDMSFEDLFV